MGVFDIFKFKKQKKYDITEKRLKKYAKITFKCIIGFYKDIYKLAVAQDELDSWKKFIREMEDEFGFGINSKFSMEYLENINFKLVSIYHYGISKIIKRKLSYSDYSLYKSMMEKTLDNSIKSRITSNESIIMNMLNVDPSILPIKYVQMVLSINDFVHATNLIIKELKKVNDFKNYDSYMQYYEYVKNKVQIINNLLHENGFYNTHNLERFTLLAMSYVCGFPTMDTLYKKPINDGETVPDEMIKEIQKRLFQMVGKNIDELDA